MDDSVFSSISSRTQPTKLRAVPSPDGVSAAQSRKKSHSSGTATTEPDRAVRILSGDRTERYRREIFERLVESARNAIYSRSLADVTVNDITEAADVGKGTFGNYFPSKEHVLLHVDKFPARILEAVERARTGAQPVRQVIENLVRDSLWPQNLDRSWLTFFENFLRALITSPDVRSLIAEQLDTTRQAYTMLIAVGQERGEFRRDRSVEELAAHLQSVFLGHTMIEWVHGGALNTHTTDAILEHTLSTLEPPPGGRSRGASDRGTREVRSQVKAVRRDHVDYSIARRKSAVRKGR